MILSKALRDSLRKVKNFVKKPFCRKSKTVISLSPHETAKTSPSKTNYKQPEKPAQEICPKTRNVLLQSRGISLEREIGKGAFGTVWLARRSDKYVAIKLIASSECGHENYDRELRAVQRMRAHDVSNGHIIPISSPLVIDDFFIYEMPLADDANGHCLDSPLVPQQYVPKTLKWKLEKAGPLAAEDCILIGCNVIKGVEELHRRNLIHRDIKPGNILFISGKAVLADFGLVTSPNPDVSQISSPGSIPPEGVGGKRGDIYAVGMLLYEMATGQPSHEGISVPSRSTGPIFDRLWDVISIAVANENSRYVNTVALESALEHIFTPDSSIPDEVSTLKEFKLAAQTRANSHTADPQDMAKYKRKIKALLNNAVDKARHDAGIQTLGVEEITDVTDVLSYEFKMRLGFVPVEIHAVNNLVHYSISESSDLLIEKYKYKFKGLFGKKDALRHHREKRAIENLFAGAMYTIDKLWDINRDQFMVV
jgi:serine/threonine protein kinase